MNSNENRKAFTKWFCLKKYSVLALPHTRPPLPPYCVGNGLHSNSFWFKLDLGCFVNANLAIIFTPKRERERERAYTNEPIGTHVPNTLHNCRE